MVIGIRGYHLKSTSLSTLYHYHARARGPARQEARRKAVCHVGASQMDLCHATGQQYLSRLPALGAAICSGCQVLVAVAYTVPAPYNITCSLCISSGPHLPALTRKPHRQTRPVRGVTISGSYNGSYSSSSSSGCAAQSDPWCPATRATPQQCAALG